MRQNRSGNIDLIRLLAAITVFYSHSWAMAFGLKSPHQEPLSAHATFMPFGLSIDGSAVHIFFLLSGFLITRSMLSSQNGYRFWAARLLRIYPAVWVLTLLSVFVAGPLLTTLPLGEYFSSMRTIKYLFHNMLLFFVRTGLPGVFNDNPMSGAFNGPLWTLPWELLAYAMTFGLFAAGVLRDKRVLVGLWVLLAVLYYYPLQSLGNTSYVRWLLCYATGSLCCVLQWPDRLRSWHVMITLGLCVLFAILKTPLYHLAALVLLAQVLLWVGMRAPTIVHLRADISYGVYIYAWPIQQILVQEIPGINAWQVAGLTAAIVVPLALASWYFVEKPMLGKKDRFAGWLEQRSNQLYCFSRNKIGG